MPPCSSPIPPPEQCLRRSFLSVRRSTLRIRDPERFLFAHTPTHPERRRAMTTKLDPRLKPADDHTDSSPTTGTDGEEVKDVAISESRQARSKKRAWDELS